MYTAWLFFEDRFKDVYFPDQNNWISQIALSQLETGWDYDVSFPVRLLDDKIFFTLSSGFTWDDGQVGRERAIPANSYFKIAGRNGSVINIIFKNLERDQLCFLKYRMPPRNLTIGRSEQSDICDPESVMSSLHGFISFKGQNMMEYTDQSANGTYFNGRKIALNTVRLQFGDMLTFPTGLKLVMLGDCIALNRKDCVRQIKLEKYPERKRPALEDDIKRLPSVYTQYHRAPRILKKTDTSHVEVEPPIAKQNTSTPPLWQQIGPSFTMVLPMLMGSVVAGNRGMLSSGVIMMSTSSALAVMWGLINRNYRKKQSLEVENHRITLYQKYIQEMELTLRDMNQQEYQRLITTYPNVGQCAMIPTDGSRQLWNRMSTHNDFLFVRLGTGNVRLPGEIEIQKQKLSIIDDPLRDEPKRLKEVYSVVADAPVTINLRNESVVGILGNAEAVIFAQGLLMQIASLHSYHDVRIVVLTSESSSSQWAWTRWLPHVFANEDREMRMVASKPDAIHDIMSHLDEILIMRKNSDGNDDDNDKDETEGTLPLPHYIIFCTDYKLLENEPIMRRLLTNRLGMTLVMVAPSLEMLPKESHLIINAASKPGLLHTSEGDTTQIDFEYANRNLLTSFAHQIAPIRVRDAVENAAIPTLVSFLDIYGVRRVEDIDIWRMWRENVTHEGLKSTIGYTAGSRPFVLDISEKHHGPHGLIAGTTGSGKSVMLQTYILSLALNYSPEAIQFILIDYKGGGMANALQSLPHVAGIIDNLQGERVIDRALASLNGEIHRREKLFKAMDVENITEYSKQFGKDPNAIKLPHLIIIADEFAELKSEQPEFMKELVSASRVGRSLGVHLILATQKPSGSVSDEIWANSRFHLCLRVQTVGDSRDMLKRPDAAYIKGTGRCFVQIGNDESFDQVQTSYAGLAYDPNMPRPEEMPRLLGDVGRPITLPKPVRPGGIIDKPKTQMDAVLERISLVAAEHNLDHSRQMWLPEMPSRIYMHDIAIFNDNCMRNGKYGNVHDELQFLLGMADDTDNQRYVPYVVNLTQMRNLMLVGLAGTGKTTAVQSIVYSLANTYDPKHLQMYVLSLTSQTLGNLGKFPHVGDIAFENDVMEIKRFINMLYEEEERRSNLFAQAATDSFIEYNRSQQMQNLPVEPAIVVFIDRYEQLRSMFDSDEATTAKIFSLVREGSGRGIHFIVTALAKNEIPFKLHSFFSGIALQLAERADYSDVIGKRVPTEMPPIASYSGRAVALMGGRPFEIQLALAGHNSRPTKSEEFVGFDVTSNYIVEERLPMADTMPDSERAKQVLAFAENQAELWTGKLPAPIPRIPENPTWEDYKCAPKFDDIQRTTYSLPVGYDLAKGELATLDLEENYSMFITGPKGSGKTNYLKLMARVFANRGAEVHIIGDSDWRQLAKEIDAKLYTERDEIIAYVHHFQETVLRDHRRPLKRAAEALGKSALRKQALEFKPYVIIIDDAQRFNTDFNALELGKELKFLHDIMSQLVSRADHYNLFFFMSASFAASSYFSQEPLRTLIAQRRGISLGGKIGECNALGIADALPFAKRNQPLPLGHAYMTCEGRIQYIVTPQAEKHEE